MNSLTFLLLCLLLCASNSSCPDLCSGHGTCGAKDKCICRDGYTGLSCADRTCLFGYGWGGAITVSDVKEYAECSNVGVCDRTTGLCKCMAGFEGDGCRRQVCPKQCSGHGDCRYVGDLATDLSPQISGRIDRKYNLWDARQAQACKCDATYTGADCSRRICAHGDDPMTNHTEYHELVDGGVVQVQVQADEVQKLLINGVNDISGDFVLEYIDQFNSTWKTRPIRVENNVGTKVTLNLMANNAGSYFSGATYVERRLNTWGSEATSVNNGGTSMFYCPFNDPGCQAECPFGQGYKYGDRLYVTGTTSQTTSFFTITAATPCKLTVHPAPVTITTSEPTTMKLISSGTGTFHLTGLGGVLHGLRSLPNRVIPDVAVTAREATAHNGKKEFDITFNHQDNSGDQRNLRCNPEGCDVDGCQPRFKGLRKSLPPIILNADGSGNNLHGQDITFTSNSPALQTDTISVAGSNTNIFANRLSVGDEILITGTS